MISTKIQKAVDKAFNMLDGLAKDVTFQKKGSSEFDFSTSEIKIATTESIVVRGIVFNETRKVGQMTNSVLKVALKKLPFNLNGYTVVVIDNDSYKFIIAESNDFVDIIEVIKEV
jgi:hypothetical protein